MDRAQTTARRDEKHLILGFGVFYIRDFTVCAFDIIATEMMQVVEILPQWRQEYIYPA